MVLFCKIHDLVAHCASLVQSRSPGAPEGGVVCNSHHLPHCSKQAKIVLDKPNAFEGSKMMCEEVIFVSVPFRNIYNDIIFPSLNPAKNFSVHFPMNRVNKKFGSWAESLAQ